MREGDLAGATSSAASKLIYGGLRYLEYYEFRLVCEALLERETLWRMAPHIIWPLRFVLPHHKGLRPAWLVRLGLFLYDHLGARELRPTTRTLRLRSTPPRTACVSARREDGLWRLTMRKETSGETYEIAARPLVNAAGPWVGDVLNGAVGASARASVRLVKGSHIVTERLFDHDRCYILQNDDGRIFFVIPYERDFTLIGTTDLDYAGDPGSVAASDDEIDYLCKAAGDYFRKPVTRDWVNGAILACAPCLTTASPPRRPPPAIMC